MSAARLAGLYEAQARTAGCSEREIAIAGVIGEALARAEGRPVSTSDLRALCLARGVTGASYAGEGRPPSYGSVVRVLEILRAIGSLTWERAHVRRWHGDRPEESTAPTPVRQHDGRYLLPVRMLLIVGFALSLVRGGVAPVADSLVSDARARLGSRVRLARLDAPRPPDSEEMGTRLSLSVGSAPRADSAESAGRSAYAILGAWRPPDDDA